MRGLFWASAGIIAYVYVGYMAWLWLRARLRPRPVQRGCYVSSVSIVMVVRNEEGVLARKIQNLLALDYPSELTEFIIVSDGSTDATDEILNQYIQHPRVRLILSDPPRGKAACLNDGIRAAMGDIVVFTDARQEIEKNALQVLLENFADSSVGCVSGEFMLGTAASGERAAGMGLYWQIEKSVRELESRSGSVVGATGALYAARRELLTSVPQGTILDDVYLPMMVAKQGKRVVFDGRARAWDAPSLGRHREFARKVRTLSGNYQLVQLAPWLLTKSNPLRFEFFSHKLMRLIIPLALAAALVSSIFCHGVIYQFAMWAQLAFYALGALSLVELKMGALGRFTDPAATFLVLNAAASLAFLHFITGRRAVWVPVSIPGPDPSRREAQS